MTARLCIDSTAIKHQHSPDGYIQAHVQVHVTQNQSKGRHRITRCGVVPRCDYHTSGPASEAVYTGPGNELTPPADQPPSLVDDQAHTKQFMSDMDGTNA